ncbi:MAG: hypothetical protein RL172_2479 [Bacteroidota bacterium]
MKEIIYIGKECGWKTAVFYLLYKIRLKCLLLTGAVAAGKRKTARLEKIYELLAMQHLPQLNEQGRRYVVCPLPGMPAASVFLRPGSSDWKVYQQVFVLKEYQPVVDIYHQFFNDAAHCIIDCGANIGMASIWLHRVFPEARFIVVEPFAENAQLAEKNFISTGLNQYKLLQGGVWSSDGLLQINRQFRDGKEWSIRLQPPLQGNGDIQAFSLPTILLQVEGWVDILKIDVEGAEQELFKDAATAANFLQRVKCLAIEIHDELDIRQDIYRVLSDNHFFYFNTNELTIAINRLCIHSPVINK